ncbi:hypothetical protein A3F03_01230 [Candidatus Roizmanbacteria bacterium RIFCSPHIGHO2_12_FULL_41_11]|uniref:Uncharacterized protein n=1 Tax=Candidatus Roizmanbacteria bacterium RIFCSPHIGHO2_12_FULL_41_11 TaxID=1802052 RepID=A0A1F7I0E9_9BACT|nr:MAG: hypothetical protein A3F03_01230 [Candidatus Roizmanbacteria bacterium RIFCSPHIGHO2_12_FULL_41_11]
MGYSGKLREKALAQKFRREGLSYKEILQKVRVSKDTICRWCRDIALSERQKRRLIGLKTYGQKKGSLIAAENKRRIRLEKIIYYQNKGKKEVGKLSERDQFVVGISLYAAEGKKSDRQIGFSNSDPRLIKFMRDWFIRYLDIPIRKMHGAIWLHKGLDEKNAKSYWSDLTQIPENQFHKTYVACLKKDSKKIRKNIHQYGIFSIRITDSDKHRRLMGWIFGLLGDKMSNIIPCSSMVEQVPVN